MKINKNALLILIIATAYIVLILIASTLFFMGKKLLVEGEGKQPLANLRFTQVQELAKPDPEPQKPVVQVHLPKMNWKQVAKTAGEFKSQVQEDVKSVRLDDVTKNVPNSVPDLMAKIAVKVAAPAPEPGKAVPKPEPPVQMVKYGGLAVGSGFILGKKWDSPDKARFAQGFEIQGQTSGQSELRMVPNGNHYDLIMEYPAGKYTIVYNFSNVEKAVPEPSHLTLLTRNEKGTQENWRFQSSGTILHKTVIDTRRGPAKREIRYIIGQITALPKFPEGVTGLIKTDETFTFKDGLGEKHHYDRLSHLELPPWQNLAKGITGKMFFKQFSVQKQTPSGLEIYLQYDVSESGNAAWAVLEPARLGVFSGNPVSFDSNGILKKKFISKGFNNTLMQPFQLDTDEAKLRKV